MRTAAYVPVVTAFVSRAWNNVASPILLTQRRQRGKSIGSMKGFSMKWPKKPFLSHIQSTEGSFEEESNVSDRLLRDEILKGENVRDLWLSSISILEERGVSEPESSTAHLLSNVLELPWSNGFMQLQQAMTSTQGSYLTEEPITPAQKDRFCAMLQRRLAHEPVQYILGKWDFLDYSEITVRPPLLCPRPETEELVELVIQDLDSSQPMKILDVGCGTGVIGIALADRLNKAQVVAIDIEPVAVKTSLENAKKVLSDNFGRSYTAIQAGAQEFADSDSGFDVVVSNPPYIPRTDMSTLSPDVLNYEAEDALFAGEDGMEVVRTIVIQWALSWGNFPGSVCWMEVDPSHPSLLTHWLNETEEGQKLGVELDSIYKDLSGLDRFVKLCAKESN